MDSFSDVTSEVDKIVNYAATYRYANSLTVRRMLEGRWHTAWLLRAASCIDLTTLAGDDTEVNVSRLCYKASHPFSQDLLMDLRANSLNLTTAAVCVYPARVKDAVQALNNLHCNIPVAAVATGFPSGQYGLETRVAEIKQAVDDGAKEIDIVINRRHVLNGDWQALHKELVAMRAACGSDVLLKTILAVGELGTLTNVYKASMIAMSAGADFIKTSTGKEAVNAILPVGVVMCRAIRDYHHKTGHKVGLKPAGGIRTSCDALKWLVLVKEELGQEWLNPKLFRIGASDLLLAIKDDLHLDAYGSHAGSYDIPRV